jgi:hypothetical protein
MFRKNLLSLSTLSQHIQNQKGEKPPFLPTIKKKNPTYFLFYLGEYKKRGSLQVEREVG